MAFDNDGFWTYLLADLVLKIGRALNPPNGCKMLIKVSNTGKGHDAFLKS